MTESPPFSRLLLDLERARSQWERGNPERARAILQLLGTQAIAASKETVARDEIGRSG